MSATIHVNEMIEKALFTSDLVEIEKLCRSPYMLVRRALAKNNNTPGNLIDRLAKDPVLNVSYIAAQNPKNSVSREFDISILPPCVTCKIVENSQCSTGCQRIEDHSF